jgi:hypothetical protein
MFGLSRVSVMVTVTRSMFVAAGLSLWTFAGCSDSGTATKQPTTPAAGHGDHADGGHGDHGHHHHHHAEKGPHDGALVAIGEDAAHLELVLDAETGKLTAYVLDGEAKAAVGIKQESLTIAFTVAKEGDKKDELPEQSTIALTPVNPADDGTANEFAGQSDELKNVKEFDAALTGITVGGKEHKGINFNYPKGNEHDHHHH